MQPERTPAVYHVRRVAARSRVTRVTERQQRWLTAVLVLGAVVLAFVLVSLIATVFFAFGAIVLVYATLVGAIVLVVVLVAGALAQSIAAFVAGLPTLREQLPQIVADWQERLRGLGLTQVDLLAQANSFLDNLANYAAQLAGPLQQLAVASLGALGNLLIVLILSLYMVVDRDAI